MAKETKKVASNDFLETTQQQEKEQQGQYKFVMSNINDLLGFELLDELSTINKDDFKDLEKHLICAIKEFKQNKERIKIWNEVPCNNNLAQIMKKARLNKKIGLRRLADNVGERPSNISMMESGLMEYPKDLLKKLADILDLNYDELEKIK